jgi:hypothetical protein
MELIDLRVGKDGSRYGFGPDTIFDRIRIWTGSGLSLEVGSRSGPNPTESPTLGKISAKSNF